MLDSTLKFVTISEETAEEWSGGFGGYQPSSYR
jgi:hypothetical protein